MQKDKNKSVWWLETYNNKNNLSSQKQIATNPIDKGGLVAKINVLGSGINSGKMTHTFVNHHNDKTYGAVDYAGFIKETNEIVKNHKTLRESLSAFHNMFINILKSIGFGGFVGNAIITIPLTVLIVYFISMIIVMMLKKVPWIKSWI